MKNPTDTEPTGAAQSLSHSDWFAMELQLAVESFEELDAKMLKGAISSSMAAKLFEIGIRHLKKCQGAHEESLKWKAKYFELLYAVEDHLPGESRHESALRCIQKGQETQGPFVANSTICETQ